MMGKTYKKIILAFTILVLAGLVIISYDQYNQGTDIDNQTTESNENIYPTTIKAAEKKAVEVRETIIQSKQETDEEISGKIILTFNEMPSTMQLSQDFGVTEDKLEINPDAHTLYLDTNTTTITDEIITDIAEKYEFTTEVEHIYTISDDYSSNLTPNDSYYSTQRVKMNQIRIPKVWDGLTGTSNKIAVIDTGINGYHEEFGDRIIDGYDYVNLHGIHSHRDSDDNGHGTAVTGIITAQGNNNTGIAGIDWSAQIIPVKAFNSGGTATTSAVINSVTWAANHGANVINMSFGSNSSSTGFVTAINYASSKDIILVAASGNDGKSSLSYPARYNHVIAVGAITDDNARASFSNYGAELDIMAPGVSVETTSDSISSYTSESGTSVAAPFVSGIASLAMLAHPGYSSAQLESAIISSGRAVSAMGNNLRTNEYGYGIITSDNIVMRNGNNNTATVTTRSPWNSTEKVNLYDFKNASYTTWVKVKNTGTSTWFKYGTNPVHLGVSGDTRSQFLRSTSALSNNRASLLRESYVKPGEVGTFRFTTYLNASPGDYSLNLRLVKEEVEWFGPNIPITIRVKSYSQNASFVSQSPWNSVHNVNVAGGNGYSTYVTVRLKNTGNTTWERNSSNPVLLGVVGDVNGFGLVGSNSFGRNRAAYPSSASVAPGETTNFTFRVAIPSWAQPGLYYTKLQLVKEGVQWFGPEVVVSYRVHPR